MARNGYKYKWAEWFAQPVTTVTYGKDYHCSQSSMCGAIRNAATMFRVRVKLTDNQNSITIRMADASANPDTPPVVGEHVPPALAATR